ncbi:hypothetical protein B0H14DRAFT_2883224, partial [Mycena olivaceomarginata]
MSSMSLFFLPFLQALWRLVRALFGGARRQADPEDGNFLAVHFPAKDAAVVADPIATYKPDLDVWRSAPPSRLTVRSASRRRKRPASLAVTIRRTSPPTPGAPRLTHPRIVYPAPSPTLCPFTVRLPAPGSHCAANVESLKAVKPASAEWQQAKEVHLKQARQWTDAVKARRESLPTPSSSSCDSKFNARRSSATVRLPLEQRLRNAVAGCASPPVVVPGTAKDALPDAVMYTLPRPGSSTSLESASSSASMESVLACVLEEFEAELESAVWMGLRRFGGGSDEKALRRNCGVYGRKEERGQGDTFEDEESSGDDHWSDV